MGLLSLPAQNPARALRVSAGTQGVTQHFPGNFLSGIAEVLPVANQFCGFSRVCFVSVAPGVCWGKLLQVPVRLT